MNAQPADRRSADRRRTHRRGDAGHGSQDSHSRPWASSDSVEGADSFFDPGWAASGDLPADSRFLLRQARRIVRAQDSALSRVTRTYAAARAAVGVGLVGAQGAGSLLGTRGSESLALICVLYAVQAITLWLLPHFGALVRAQSRAAQRRRQWLATIGIDLVAFALLHALEGGNSLNYAALLVLPVLMAGVLTSRLIALGTAAGVSLLLLAVAWRAALAGAEASALMLQSGLAGMGMFIIALLAGELARRLAGEELAAKASRELARQQAQLNRLVIEEMADGVLVVDRQLRVRAANPAARVLLVEQGLSATAPFALHQEPAWAGLLRAVERALAEGEWPDGGRDVGLAFGGGHTRTLRVRVRFMRRRGLDGEERKTDTQGEDRAAEPFAVLLLEDLRTLQARIRQEKLAAMGRVSAGIAHEIRNPLAAIAQANALLMEDELARPQRRLAQMVADNVERLKRLVDDVMEVAPAGVPDAQVIDAAAVVARAQADWARTVQLPSCVQGRLRAELPAAPLGVAFDAEHLRRVLVNLLDNAHRHATNRPGAIDLRLAPSGPAWAALSVLSDGPPIAPEIERHLFEPFFSTRSQGSGLGLYICRELCERYGASIEYLPRPATESLRNEFVVRMRRAGFADLDHPLTTGVVPTP